MDTQVARTFARIEEKSMQNTDACVVTDEREEIPSPHGAAKQLEQILARGLPALYRRAYRILRNAADAEDAVQDALLAAYTHLNQFRGQSQVSTWLTAIVLNCARLQLRRRRRHVHVSLDESAGELQPVSVSERLADHRRGSDLLLAWRSGSWGVTCWAAFRLPCCMAQLLRYVPGLLK